MPLAELPVSANTRGAMMYGPLPDMKLSHSCAAVLASLFALTGSSPLVADPVQTDAGMVEGTAAAGIHIFKGIPYAAPPVGDLRWKAPQPVPHWDGVRQADQFGPRAIQTTRYADMVFRDAGPSEDCLYLNVWTPAIDPTPKLPVMV